MLTKHYPFISNYGLPRNLLTVKLKSATIFYHSVYILGKKRLTFSSSLTRTLRREIPVKGLFSTFLCKVHLSIPWQARVSKVIFLTFSCWTSVLTMKPEALVTVTKGLMLLDYCKIIFEFKWKSAHVPLLRAEAACACVSSSLSMAWTRW